MMRLDLQILTDTDFNTSGKALIDAIGGTTDGSVEVWGFFDDSNTAFGETADVVNFIPLIGPDGDFADSGQISLAGADFGLYSLTKKIMITHGSAGDVTSFNNSLRVPEPGTLSLLGIGMVGLIGGVARKRKKKKGG